MVKVPTALREDGKDQQKRNIRENTSNLMSRVLYTPHQRSRRTFSNSRKRETTRLHPKRQQQTPFAPFSRPSKHQKVSKRLPQNKHNILTPVTPLSTNIPKPPAERRLDRQLSGREKALFKTQKLGTKDNFDIIFEVNQKVKEEILSKRKTFMKGQKEDKKYFVD